MIIEYKINEPVLPVIQEQLTKHYKDTIIGTQMHTGLGGLMLVSNEIKEIDPEVKEIRSMADNKMSTIFVTPFWDGIKFVLDPTQDDIHYKGGFIDGFIIPSYYFIVRTTDGNFMMQLIGVE